MNDVIIIENYKKARESIIAGNIKEARDYVKNIYNEAYELYKRANTQVSKRNIEVFVRRWVQVSKDLYYKGITEYVLGCFSLTKQDLESHFEVSESQGWCADIYEKYKKSVVKIIAEFEYGNEVDSFCGTGFIISSNGYLLTNHHVVYEDRIKGYYNNIFMVFTDTNKEYKIQVICSDSKNDVALCKFDASKVKDFSVVESIRDYSKLMPGADCVVLGNSLGMGINPSPGKIRFTKDSEKGLIHSALTNNGDSGAPVINRQGYVVGINKESICYVNGHEVDGFRRATSMDKIKELLSKWAEEYGLDLSIQ